jgi:hypothetical protein
MPIFLFCMCITFNLLPDHFCGVGLICLLFNSFWPGRLLASHHDIFPSLVLNCAWPLASAGHSFSKSIQWDFGKSLHIIWSCGRFQMGINYSFRNLLQIKKLLRAWPSGSSGNKCETLSSNLIPHSEKAFFQYLGLNSGRTPRTTPPAFSCDGYFWDRVSRTFCPRWLPTTNLLISDSWVARIIGMSHWHLAPVFF